MKGITTSKITFERTEETKNSRAKNGITTVSKISAVNLRLNENTYKKIRELAFLNDTSYSNLVRNIIEQAVKDYELKLLV